MFLKYKTKIEKQLDKENKRLRYYRGGEYNDKSLHEYCELNGITLKLPHLILVNKMI